MKFSGCDTRCVAVADVHDNVCVMIGRHTAHVTAVIRSLCYKLPYDSLSAHVYGGKSQREFVAACAATSFTLSRVMLLALTGRDTVSCIVGKDLSASLFDCIKPTVV